MEDVFLEPVLIDRFYNTDGYLFDFDGNIINLTVIYPCEHGIESISK